MAETELLTVEEIADKLRVSRATVTNWLRSGQLRGYRVGGKRAGWRIESGDFDQFMVRLKSGEPAE